MALINLAVPASGTLARWPYGFNVGVAGAMLNTLGSFEFQDSEVADVQTRASDLVVRFSAAHLHLPGEGPASPGAEGFVPALVLACQQVADVQCEPGCLGRLSAGQLKVNGVWLRTVPVPFEARGHIELELVFANGAVCLVTAASVSMGRPDLPRFVEWLRC